MRQLGLGDSVSIIMGIMIGSGIFLMAGSVARQLHSLLAVTAVWAFGGLLSLCGALSLSELGAAFPAAGGLYVYLEEAYGPAMGFLYGWCSLTLIHAGSIATMAAAIGFYSAPLFGLSPHGQKFLQVFCIAVFTLVNCRGVAFGKWVQNTLAVAKVGGIVLMVVLLYSRGSRLLLAAHFWPGGNGPVPWTAFGVALVAVLWAYDGWHMVSFTAGEIKDPSRTLPRSLLIGTLLTSAIYLVVNVAYYAVLTPAAIRGTDRVASFAVEHAFGAGAGVFISVLILVSILGAINGVILGAPRICYAMARDGIFFRSFGRVHPRFRTPVVATLAQGFLAAVFTLVGTFQQLFTSYIFTAWIFYGLSVAALIVLRRRRPDLERPYRCPLYPVTPLFFIAATIAIVISTFVADFWQALLGLGLVLVGFPFYFVFRALERRNPSPLDQSAESA